MLRHSFCIYALAYIKKKHYLCARFLAQCTRIYANVMKIALIGYGKMGHMIEEVALERGHEIVARIDAGDAFDLNGADVVIEFTTPQTAEANIRAAWAQKVPVVCGSTGWNAQAMMDEDRRLHGKPMLVWKSNFSVGVNIVFDLNRMLAQIMSRQPQYTPSIKEIHHIHKLDAPSGTAKTLAEQIGAEVPIESVREGEVPGTHIVTWDSPEDTIVLTHIAKGRRGFALGAVLEAEKIVTP